jgi:alkanesulfonate monooxygenase SsuD/methylene tetrahydromethanopterin reductase-like flavin-dependent oxidoreductase (luciferase family)
MAGRLSFGIAAALGPDIAAAVAPDVERLGYASLWANDGAPAAGLPLLAAAQRATRALRTGVGVIPCDLRAPAEVVATISALGIDLGRTVVGVGAGRAEHPVKTVRAAVAALRARLPGATIGIAALGPRMCRLGGEVADLVLLNWMTPERIGWARERIAEGARRGDRPVPVVASYVRVAIGPDARERLAAEAGRYERSPQYVRARDAMGVPLAGVGIVTERAEDVVPALAQYLEVLDECVIRALPSPNDAEGLLAVARSGVSR